MKNTNQFSFDQTWKGLIKWGGLSLFLAASALVIFILLVIVTQQTIPVPAKEFLENPTFPVILFLIAVFGETLLLPGIMALYFTLKNVTKTAMMIASGLWVLCVPLFLVSRGQLLGIAQISERYLSTTNEALKAAYIAAAELTLETQNMYSTMALVLLSVPTIIIGVVMLKSAFGKPLGYLVIAAGSFSIFTPFGVIFMDIPNIIPFIGLVLSAIWQLIAGAKLYRLGKEIKI